VRAKHGAPEPWIRPPMKRTAGEPPRNSRDREAGYLTAAEGGKEPSRRREGGGRWWCVDEEWGRREPGRVAPLVGLDCSCGLDSERRSRSPRQDRRNEELCARQGRQPAQWWRVREPRETGPAGPPTRQVGARSRPWLASGCSVTFLAVGFPFPGSRVFSVVDGWRITGSAALLAFLVCFFRGGWRRSLVIAWIGWRPARYGGCGLGLRLARVRAQSVAPPPTTLHVRCGDRESFLLPPLGRTGNVPAHDRCSSRAVTTGAPAREGGRHTSFSRAVRLVGTVLAPARGERRPSRPVPAPTHGMGMAAHREGQTGTERGAQATGPYFGTVHEAT
jgi:hypothetical protein